jgi:SAM-dependent methyltransferase
MQVEPVSHLEEHRSLMPQVRYTAKVIERILSGWFAIDSVLDLGCGIGTWLDVFSKGGQRSIVGVEAERLADSELVIDQKHFINADISLPVDLKKRFDLVLLLETAEHINAKFAPIIIDNAARHSDLILFSAAIPGQGGLDHVNEQLPEYWVKLFDMCDFEVFDIVRHSIWNDDCIPSWYRQNLLVFSRRSSEAHRRITSLGFRPSDPPLGRVHPSLLQWYSHELFVQNQ